MREPRRPFSLLLKRLKSFRWEEGLKRDTDALWGTWECIRKVINTMDRLTDRHGGASEEREPGPMWHKRESINPFQGWGGFTVQACSQALRFPGQR